MTTERENAMWMRVSQEVFERVQVGKSYRFDGRVGKVVQKSQGEHKSSTGWADMVPMVKVEWR